KGSHPSVGIVGLYTSLAENGVLVLGFHAVVRIHPVIETVGNRALIRIDVPGRKHCFRILDQSETRGEYNVGTGWSGGPVECQRIELIEIACRQSRRTDIDLADHF